MAPGTSIRGLFPISVPIRRARSQARPLTTNLSVGRAIPCGTARVGSPAVMNAWDAAPINDLRTETGPLCRSRSKLGACALFLSRILRSHVSHRRGWVHQGEHVASLDDSALQEWFCCEVLCLEASLTAFIRRNWREADEVADLRQEIYERALIGARNGLPRHTNAYLYAIARNHLANRARRGKVVSIDFLADLEVESLSGAFHPEPTLIARDELRRAVAGLERLPPRCREIVRLRKVEGLSTRAVAERMGVGIDTVEKQLSLGMRALADFMLGGAGRVQRPTRAGSARWRKTP